MREHFFFAYHTLMHQKAAGANSNTNAYVSAAADFWYTSQAVELL